MPITLGLVDDHDLIRRGLRMMLQEHEDLNLIWEATSGQEALNLLGRQPVQVLLVDIDLGKAGMDGIELTRNVRARGLDVQIIMVTMLEEADTIRRAIEAGATGYLLKDVDSRALAEAVSTVVGGGSAINPRVSRQILAQFTSAPQRLKEATPASELSLRERQVLGLLFEGKSNQEIADTLFIAEKTVTAHMTSLLRKLGVKDRTQAVLYAMKHNLIDRTAT